MKPKAIRLGHFWLLALILFAGQATAFSFGKDDQARCACMPDFTRLVEQNSAAVVNISTTQKVKHPHRMPPGMEIPDIPEDSPFGDLLRRFFGEQGGEDEGPEMESQSLGSGFIIDAHGYIVTNNHVVKNAEEIIVRLSDRRELKAKLIGTDPRSDMALLKVEADNLPIVKIGKSEKLKVGEWVMAIGSPFGFDHSVSVGVVSAIGRNLPSENYVPYIQTDVAINPGNSGGPLFNSAGEVVGINSQIYSRTGGFMGLSFAIPIDVAMDVVEQLKTRGKVVRGWLGILIQDVNRELAESFGMDRPEGAVVLKVMPDSPAAKAGLQVGDVIIDYNGKRIHQSSDLPLEVGRTRVGSTVPVTVIREGKRKTLKVTIAELPAEDELAEKAGTPKDGKVKADRLGLVVEKLTDSQRKELGTGKRGVLVRKVGKGPAREAGIRPGDVILMINNKDVTDPGQFRKLVKSLPAGRSVPVLIQRGGSPVFLPLKIPKP